MERYLECMENAAQERRIKGRLAGMKKEVVFGPVYFLMGKLLVLTGRYDRKYCCGKYFSKRHFGLFSTGWRWMVKDWRLNRRFGQNQSVPWPVDPRCHVAFPENIVFHPDDLNNFQSFGIYYQAFGGITIGRGTYIGPNVGLITANHDVTNLDTHQEPQPITLGEGCWIGMNSVILPGITLGDNTVVGAGAVVTKSFSEGYCVIAGNPARKIKELQRENL